MIIIPLPSFLTLVSYELHYNIKAIKLSVVYICMWKIKAQKARQKIWNRIQESNYGEKYFKQSKKIIMKER